MKTVILLMSFTILAGGVLSGTTILLGPLPYLSEEDSPFIEGIREGTIYLEDFEDQALNTPFVREPAGLTYFGTTYRERIPNVPHGVVWSVDGDDGLIDGNGFSGDTWITTSFASQSVAGRMRFEFVPDLLGRYPTFVGIVITRVEDVDIDVDMGFFDATGRSVYNDAEFDPKDWNPPGGAGGGDPRTHRFVGVFHEEGIATLAIDNVWQVDHLHYGYAIPEPEIPFLWAVGGGMLLWRGRKRASTHRDQRCDTP